MCTYIKYKIKSLFYCLREMLTIAREQSHPISCNKIYNIYMIFYFFGRGKGGNVPPSPTPDQAETAVAAKKGPLRVFSHELQARVSKWGVKK